MTQTVSLPIVNMASTVDSPPVLENSPELQGATEPFSGLLALLNNSLGNPPVTSGGLQAKIDTSLLADNGQELPLEELVDGNSGETLPLLADVVEPSEKELTDKAPVTTVTAAINTILVKEAPQEFTTVEVVDESLRGDESIITTGISPQPVDTNILPVIKQPLITEQAKPENPLSGMLLQEQSVKHQAINQLQNQELVSKQGQMIIDIDDMDTVLQTTRTISEELMKPVVRSSTPSIDSSIVMQNLRQIATPVAGSEISNSNELTGVLSTVQAAAPVSAQSSTQLLASLSVNTPLQNTGWNQEITDKIQWMVNQKFQGAEIKLNPAHLGPMEVKIQMQNDQVTVQFTAAHGVVRDALESAIPRLKEMFDNQGVQLADVDVSENSFTRQRQTREDNPSHHSTRSIENQAVQNMDDASVESWTTPVSVVGRLDLFA